MRLINKALNALNDRKYRLHANRIRSPYYELMAQQGLIELEARERKIKQYARSRYTR